jgi:hypothetical protein
MMHGGSVLNTVVDGVLKCLSYLHPSGSEGEGEERSFDVRNTQEIPLDMIRILNLHPVPFLVLKLHVCHTGTGTR